MSVTDWAVAGIAVGLTIGWLSATIHDIWWNRPRRPKRNTKAQK